MTKSTDPAFVTAQAAVLSELGPLGVERGGQWASVRGPMATMLLAGLGLAGHSGVRTEELIEMIWPSPDQPATARQSLANIVLRLRTAHGASFIESTGQGYRIGEQVGSDRQRFVAAVERAGGLVRDSPDRALELVDEALTRWRGEPWVGIERPVAVEADRAQLTEAHTTALRVRATSLIALDRREHALPVLGEVLDADPYDESSRTQLVRLLTDMGRRVEAIRTIQQAHQVFSDRGLVLDGTLAGIERELLSDEFMSDFKMEPLPAQLTDFVGRRHEVEEVASLLHANRLVTLHGTGGSGKTRLALHVASEIGEPGESGFVDLTAAETRAHVEQAFARGLGLPTSHLDRLNSLERCDALTDAASRTSGVLVVDNCEHVVRDVREVVRLLLARPGRLRTLATSRVPLEVAGEYRYRLPPFGDGSELFLRRAAQRGVSIDVAAHADNVAKICALVDELPLAIEIAAAQTPYRTVHEIAEELERGIVHRDRTQLASRHETMADAIRWSHELLDADAANALIKLGVFVAPFELNDAAAVINGGDITRLLGTLVRHSLLERAERAGRSTYRLPVPVQQYCAAELERRGASTEVLLALAEWLLEFTDRPYGDVWWRLSVIDEVNPRFPHALAAIAALRAIGRADDATRLASRLGGAARAFGHADELIKILTELWTECDDAEATSDALVALVLCADAARRRKVVSQAVSHLDNLDGPVGRRHGVFLHCEHALDTMWAALLGDADFGPTHKELRRAREQTEALDSPINRAQLERWQSAVHLVSGDWAAAEAAARRALEDSVDTTFDLFATSCLCHARLHLGDPHAALQHADRHPQRDGELTHGNLLGMVSAIARVQGGDANNGLAAISHIQRRARQARFEIQQDDAAITIAYIAHLLRHDDLTLQILETGVLGYGPWVGYLVPKMCRDLGIPLMGHVSKSVAERQERSVFYGTVASRVLRQLCERQPQNSAPAPDGRDLRSIERENRRIQAPNR